jgi:ribA/ribD-fused uncharacterized protein
MAVDRFEGEFRFLSNFYMCPLRVGGLAWPSAEHAFQGLKSPNPDMHRLIAALPTPGEAKRGGRTLNLRPDWERVKKQVMLTVLLAKFTQNPELGARLADTADMADPLLTEGNYWHDNYWGACFCDRCKFARKPGLNYLGRLLMAVRDVVRCD